MGISTRSPRVYRKVRAGPGEVKKPEEGEIPDFQAPRRHPEGHSASLRCTSHSVFSPRWRCTSSRQNMPLCQDGGWGKGHSGGAQLSVPLTLPHRCRRRAGGMKGRGTSETRGPGDTSPFSWHLPAELGAGKTRPLPTSCQVWDIYYLSNPPPGMKGVHRLGGMTAAVGR